MRWPRAAGEASATARPQGPVGAQRRRNSPEDAPADGRLPRPPHRPASLPETLPETGPETWTACYTVQAKKCRTPPARVRRGRDRPLRAQSVRPGAAAGSCRRNPPRVPRSVRRRASGRAARDARAAAGRRSAGARPCARRDTTPPPRPRSWRSPRASPRPRRARPPAPHPRRARSPRWPAAHGSRSGATPARRAAARTLPVVASASRKATCRSTTNCVCGARSSSAWRSAWRMMGWFAMSLMPGLQHQR